MLLLLGLGLQWHHEALLALKSGDHDLQALGKQTTCVAFFIRPIKAFGVKTNEMSCWRWGCCCWRRFCCFGMAPCNVTRYYCTNQTTSWLLSLSRMRWWSRSASMQRDGHEDLLHKSNDFMAPESLTYAMVEPAYELSCNVASHCPLRWILNGGSGSSI